VLHFILESTQLKANQRRLRGSILDRNKALQTFVKDKLTYHRWTPEQIAGYLKFRQKKLTPVSHETIYKWLYMKTQKHEKLWKYLVRHKARRGLRKPRGAGVSRIPNRISIHERPNIGNKRKKFGHWEADLMSFQKNSQHIVVLRERKSMLTLSRILDNKKADTTAKAIQDLMRQIPSSARKTITFDNGGEFARHHEVAQNLQMLSFFCDPYASWQKGGVENTNGILRRDLPRNTDLKKTRKEDFDETLENYNSTPRKKLDWFTPIEAFNNNLRAVALQT
jgi:transposase, IS30 family